jgi:DNA-binding MarR family transcriptional regulator
MNEAAAHLGDELSPGGLRSELGWLLSQVQHGYLAAAVAAYGDLPGGMKGFYVLGAAVEGSARNQIEVARRFCIDRTVMVRLVDELERAGLVERRPDPADRRARTIAVTAAGRVRHAEVQQRLDAVDDHVLEPLSGAEREVFDVLLRQVVARLVAIDPTHGVAACDAVRDHMFAESGDEARAADVAGA